MSVGEARSAAIELLYRRYLDRKASSGPGRPNFDAPAGHIVNAGASK
jgi:hypothetical protein